MSKYYLGKLCLNKHDSNGKDQSLRYRNNGSCKTCTILRNAKYKKANKINNKNTICKNCKDAFYKSAAEKRHTFGDFCSKSCSATWHNTHKTKGFRRSKLEIYLEKVLLKTYPDLPIVFNDKSTINSELDIYFPTLKLGVELNGIFHCEPIYGKIKLDQIQNNDNRKMIACYQQGIELVVIDTTKKGSRKYFNIIKNILSQKYPKPESN